MTGPEQTYNPVLEALGALDDLAAIDSEGLPASELIAYHGARAVAWSLLASVTGGQTINLGPPPAGEAANPLEQKAKAAFHD